MNLLSSKDFINFQSTCRLLYDIASSEVVCKFHYEKKFPRSANYRPSEQPEFEFSRWQDYMPFKWPGILGDKKAGYSHTWKFNYLYMHAYKGISLFSYQKEKKFTKNLFF